MSKTNLMTASRQWATRPADERFWNLREMFQTLNHRKIQSAEAVVPTAAIQTVAVGGDVQVKGPGGELAKLSHWSAGQLANIAGVPADYLRKIPAELAVTNLNYGLGCQGEKTSQVLLCRENGLTVRAVTTDYSRLWSDQIVKQAIQLEGSGWMVPPARPYPGSESDPRCRPATKADILPNQDDFGLAVNEGDMIAPAGCYASDRDMFIFLVNPARMIDDGGKGLMRGCFIWNSEVGAGSFSLTTFMLENVCGNHIVWGASSVQKLRIVHRGDKVKRMPEHLHRELVAIAAMAPEEEKMIVAAKRFELGRNRTDVEDKLFALKSVGLSKKAIERSFDFAEKWEHTAGSAPTTAWGFVHGLTRFSQTHEACSGNADARTTLDEAGGKILSLVYSGKLTPSLSA